ncbi:MAG: tripartite tricarboxylate transporter substrate-binding protein, partial [Comamonas sp.]
VSPWFATFMPAGTPAPIVEKLGKTLNEAMNDPEVKKRLSAIGAEPIGSTPQALAAHLKTETDRWTKLIKESNIKVD